jgi:multidrug resistance efflux pump
MSIAKRLAARISLATPFAVLLGTFGLAWAVRSGDDARSTLAGFAHGAPENVAALEPARISGIHVSVGTEVTEGQLIASLDTSAVDGEIAIAHAEKARIEAAMKADRTALGRKLEVDRETLEREATREREDLARVDAEARALDNEIDRVKKLVAEHQAVAADLGPMTLRRAQLSSLANEKPRTLGLLDRQLGAATQRRAEVDDAASPAAAKLEADLLVVNRRIEMLDKRRANHQLRATTAGRVVSLDKQPGEVANAGEAIVRLVRATNRVVVCLPERRSLSVREGDAARLWVRGNEGAPIAARTVALGPMVAELPARCWPNPKLPVWGREITVAIDTPTEILAGEAFAVALDGVPAEPLPTSIDKGNPVAKKAETPSETAPNEPRFMTVPAALAKRTRFEPSGVLSRPGEGRYLLVSDDTGVKGGPDEGRPWLFSMDRSGAVAPSPISIAGVESIDDLEAIASGDGGELYVLSSQSHNAHGRRRSARSALLRLRPDGAGFKVDGEVHLAELLDRYPARAIALGLADGTRSLDIEGMAWRGGALYFGLKAPLDASGNAQIWKVASPRALFEAASGEERALERAGLSSWAHARVDVEIEGKTVPGGISDLAFVGDSLVITSTPSTADGAAGALWRADRPRGGAIAATLVRRFPRMKPEGLSAALDAASLMVVFDAGSSTPSFLEMPWPR